MKRRQVLTSGGALGVAGLAGCLDILSGQSATGNTNNVAKWLPEPADLADDQDHYEVTANSPKRRAKLVDNPLFRSEFAPNLDYANPRATDVKYTVSAGAGGRNFDVYAGSFNEGWILDRMDIAENLDRDSDVEDFAVFVRETTNGVSEAYAISSQAYIHAIDDRSGFNQSPDALDVLTTVIDARVGNIGRYHEENQDLGRLVDELSFGHDLTARTMESTGESSAQFGQFENVVARGSTNIIQGETTDTQEVIVFEAERDIREREIVEYIEESDSFNQYRERPSYDIANRAVLIEGTRTGANF